MEGLSPFQTQDIITFWQIKLAKIIFILAASLIIYWVVRYLIHKFTAKIPQKRLATLLILLNSVAGLGVFTVATLTILTEFEINITPILASAGILGLAVGFGAQTLVKDLISGMFILAEDQIRVGDIVKIGELTGELEKIGLRTISIRDFSGSLTIIPNSDVTKISNLTRGWSQIDLKIDVSAKNSIDEVLETVKLECLKFSKDKNFSDKLISPVEVLGIEEIAGGKVTIQIVGKTKPKKQFNLTRSLLYQLKRAFEEKGLEFA